MTKESLKLVRWSSTYSSLIKNPNISKNELNVGGPVARA
jgi:hypothetical protein